MQRRSSQPIECTSSQIERRIKNTISFSLLLLYESLYSELSLSISSIALVADDISSSDSCETVIIPSDVCEVEGEITKFPMGGDVEGGGGKVIGSVPVGFHGEAKFLFVGKDVNILI